MILRARTGITPVGSLISAIVSHKPPLFFGGDLPSIGTSWAEDPRIDRGPVAPPFLCSRRSPHSIDALSLTIVILIARWEWAAVDRTRLWPGLFHCRRLRPRCGFPEKVTLALLRDAFR